MLPLRAPTMRSVPEIVSAKLCARAGAHLLHAEQQHDAEGDGEHGERGGERAVAQRLHRQARNDRAGRSCGGAPLGDGDLVEPQHAVEARAELLLVAHHDERRAGRLRLGEQQIEEGELPVAVERRGRLVGDDQLRPADQRARRGDALLLADAEVRGRSARKLGGVEPEALRAGARASSSAGPLRAARSRRPRRKAQRQQHVVEDRAVGQQVEHLEDDAEVLGAEAVARRVDSRVRSVPSTSSLPACGATIPQSRLRNVDLPLPDGPTSSTRWRAGSAKSSIDSENDRAPGQRKRTPDILTTSGAEHVRCDALHHMMPARSSVGLSRLTSYLLCPLAVTTLTVRSCAPANSVK